MIGRGLSSLLENPETDITTRNDSQGKYVVGAVSEIPVLQIEANPFQPRDEFEKKALDELADSIQTHGLIQPVTVRKLGYDKYQLISGERRFRATQMAGLETIPAYIRVADDEQMLEWALIENIHREDLNPMALAISFQRLIEECRLTQEELGNKLSMNRSSVTNYLRLLKLPPVIQDCLRQDQITMGHARALIGIEDAELQGEICSQIISEGLSVRVVEQLVRDSAVRTKPKIRKEIKTLPPHIEQARNQLSGRLNTGIEISYNNKGKGSIVISFNSEKEFNDIIHKISEA